jgi:hypothetical protein
VKTVLTCLLIEKDNERFSNHNNNRSCTTERSTSLLNKKIAARNLIRKSFLDVLDYWLHVSFPLRDHVNPKLLFPSIKGEVFIESVYIDGIDILSNAVVEHIFCNIHTVLLVNTTNSSDVPVIIIDEVSVPSYKGKIKFI